MSGVSSGNPLALPALTPSQAESIQADKNGQLFWVESIFLKWRLSKEMTKIVSLIALLWHNPF
jgi:hypothetical protein